MKARVKDGYRLNVVTAFGGYEFIKGQWRDVPVGHEAEAVRHFLLDTDAAENGGNDESSGATVQRRGSRKRGQRDG